MELKNILILGMGISGKSIYNSLKEKKLNLYVSDSNEKNIENIKEKFVSFDKNKIDLVIKSPGIKPENEVLEEARKRNIKIITDIELFNMMSDKKIVAITGTNGKTTTTSLISSLLSNSYKIKTVGNIGVGVMDALDSKDDYVIVECSSFQLNDILKFKPKISVITNITPDHLDWHGSFENYKEAKLNILKNQDDNDICVLNYSDSILKVIKPNSKTYYFSINDHGKKGTFIKDNYIYFRDDNEYKVFNLDKLKLLGNHNLENTLAAVCVSKILNINDEIIEEALNNFSGVEHRLEFVRNLNGVNYYNDSKGTNPDSTIKAVESFEKDLILIAGGYQKNADYTEMLKIAKVKLKHLILLGETKYDIEKTAKLLNIKTTLVDNLEEATKLANKISHKGDSILLSPACASWDMYSCFEERGNHFKKLVMNFNEKI